MEEMLTAIQKVQAELEIKIQNYLIADPLSVSKVDVPVYIDPNIDYTIYNPEKKSFQKEIARIPL